MLLVSDSLFLKVGGDQFNLRFPLKIFRNTWHQLKHIKRHDDAAADDDHDHHHNYACDHDVHHDHYQYYS